MQILIVSTVIRRGDHREPSGLRISLTNILEGTVMEIISWLFQITCIYTCVQVISSPNTNFKKHSWILRSYNNCFLAVFLPWYDIFHLPTQFILLRVWSHHSSKHRSIWYLSHPETLLSQSLELLQLSILPSFYMSHPFPISTNLILVLLSLTRNVTKISWFFLPPSM